MMTKTLILIFALLLPACASSPDTTDLADAMKGMSAGGNNPASGSIDSGSDEQNDKAFNLGASYLGDVDQNTFSMYGSRKTGEANKTGKIQTGLMFGSVNMERAAALREKRMETDPVVIGLLARQKVLLKAFAEADGADAQKAIGLQLDAIDAKLAAASAAADNAIASMGGSTNALTHLTVINISGGDDVGQDPTDTTDKEADAAAGASGNVAAIITATKKTE